MEEVTTEAAVDDIVSPLCIKERIRARIARASIKRCEVGGLLQSIVEVDIGELQVARCVDALVNFVDLEYAIQRLRELITDIGQFHVAAGVDAAVITQHTVNTCASRDPVVTVTTDQVIILRVAVEDILAEHAVDEVIARLATDHIVATDVALHDTRGIVCGINRQVRTALRVIEELG